MDESQTLTEIEKETSNIYGKSPSEITAIRGRLIRKIKKEIKKIKEKEELTEEETRAIEDLEERLNNLISDHKAQLSDRYDKEFIKEKADFNSIVTVLPKAVGLSARKVNTCVNELQQAKTNKSRLFKTVELLKALGLFAATPVIYTVKFIANHWYLVLLLLSLLKLPGSLGRKKKEKDNDNKNGKNQPDPDPAYNSENEPVTKPSVQKEPSPIPLPKPEEKEEPEEQPEPEPKPEPEPEPEPKPEQLPVPGYAVDKEPVTYPNAMQGDPRFEVPKEKPVPNPNTMPATAPAEAPVEQPESVPAAQTEPEPQPEEVPVSIPKPEQQPEEEPIPMSDPEPIPEEDQGIAILSPDTAPEIAQGFDAIAVADSDLESLEGIYDQLFNYLGKKGFPVLIKELYPNIKFVYTADEFMEYYKNVYLGGPYQITTITITDEVDPLLLYQTIYSNDPNFMQVYWVNSGLDYDNVFFFDTGEEFINYLFNNVNSSLSQEFITYSIGELYKNAEIPPELSESLESLAKELGIRLGLLIVLFAIEKIIEHKTGVKIPVTSLVKG